MGVDYYHCESCDESQYEEYVGWCQGCSKGLCTSCLTNNDIGSNYAWEYGLKFDSTKPELMKEYKEKGFELYKEDGSPYYEDGETIDDSSIAPKYCPFCEGIQINRDEVLDYLLFKYNVEIEDVWKELQEKK